jgi:hypothetical protein
MEIELAGVHAADLSGARQFREPVPLLLAVEVEHKPIAVVQDYVHFSLGVPLT